MNNKFKGVSFRLPTQLELGQLEIFRWPDRKQVSLGIGKDNSSVTLAYFQSEEKAQMFVDWLHKSYQLLGGLREEE